MHGVVGLRSMLLNLWSSLLLLHMQGKVRNIALFNVTKMQQGQTTEVFRRYPLPEFDQLSFSLIYKEKNGKTRSLDVICRNMMEFEFWYWGLQLVITEVQNLSTPTLPSIPEPQMTSPTKRVSVAIPSLLCIC